MDEQWCRRQLESLQIEDKRTEALTELKTILSVLSENENKILEEVAKSTNLFECFNEINRLNISLHCVRLV